MLGSTLFILMLVLALGVHAFFFSSAVSVILPGREAVCEMHFVTGSDQIRLDIKITPPSPTSILEFIRPSEMVSEPIKGKTLVSDDQTMNCLLPIQNEAIKRHPRLNRPYRFLILPACRNQPLALTWLSHNPEVDVPLKFQLFAVGDQFYEKQAEAILPPFTGPAKKILCRQALFEHQASACSALDIRGGTITMDLTELIPASYSESVQPSKSGTYNDIPYLIYPKPSILRPVFFGDLHVHTAFSDARVPIYPDQALEYARQTSHLDFVAITDHAENVFREPMGEREIALTHHAIMEHTIPLEFTAFFGFEWTSSWNNPDSSFGHRNVIYPDLFPNVLSADLYPTPELLYKNCQNCIGIVHHPMMIWGGFAFETPPISGFEGPVEVFSTHGNFEEHLSSHGPWFRKNSSIQAGLKKGWKMRLMASSDTHLGHPGLVRWPELNLHDLDGGGVIAVFAQNNTREQIYSAIQKGLFYGTTGPHILLLPKDSKNLNELFPLEIHGTAPIASLHLVEIHSEGRLFEQTITIHQKLPADMIQVLHHHESKVHSLIANLTPCSDCEGYYAKIVQEDGHIAYIGPIWIN